MSNIEIYNGIFTEVFGVSADVLGTSFSKENNDQRDEAELVH